MAAPEGNQFWKLRAKHGRDTLFETPELLWEAACEYFEWCDSHPLMEAKLASYEGNHSIEDVPKMRVYTLTGLCFYIQCSEAYFRNFKHQNEEKGKDFITVIDHIEKIIRDQKFTGAASGFFNANIIARDLGLKDQSDVTTNGKDVVAKPTSINVYNNAPPLADAEDKITDKPQDPSSENHVS